MHDFATGPFGVDLNSEAFIRLGLGPLQKFHEKTHRLLHKQLNVLSAQPRALPQKEKINK